jgi:hypothetical protein
MKRYTIFIFLLVPSLLWAQDENWENQGDIEDTQVIIEKNREIELPRANRKFDKVPPIQNTSDLPDRIDFTIKEIQPTLPVIKPRIRVLTVKSEKLNKLYGNHVKAGLGNYGATYLDGYFTNKRNKTTSIGAKIHHLNYGNGPVDDKNSGWGEQSVDLFGKLIGEGIVFKGGVFYDRQKSFLYGYPEELAESIDRDSIKRNVQDFGLGFQLQDKDKEDAFAYSLGSDFHYTTASYDVNEVLWNFDLATSYQLTEQWSGSIGLNGFLANYTRGNRSIIRIDPTVGYQMFDNLTLSAGLNIVNESEPNDEYNKLRVLPHAEGTFQPTNSILIKAGFKGDVEAFTFNQLGFENPYFSTLYVQPLIQYAEQHFIENNEFTLVNTVVPFKFYGDIEGSLGNNLAFLAGFSIANPKRLPVYQYAGNGSFNVNYYLSTVNIVNFHAGVSASFANDLSISSRIDLYNYDTPIAGEVLPNRPSLIFNTAFPEEAVNDSAEEYEGSIIDLGISLEYYFTKRATAFIQTNNLISKEYQYWFNYPNRGFQIMIGGSYSF